MFCPKCGTKNADDAHFCCKCGNSLSLKYPEQPVSRPMQERAETTRQKPKTQFVLLGILFAFILIAAAAVFIIRGANENSLLSNVTTTIADGSEDDVTAYYDQYLPVSYADGGYMKECHYGKQTDHHKQCLAVPATISEHCQWQIKSLQIIQI